MLALAALCLLGGCQPKLTRPPQDNFTIRAGSGGIRPFIAALEHAFRTTAEPQKLILTDSEPTELFRINGSDVTIIVAPVADDRCDPNAPMHSTYKQGEYRVDLVYETSSNKKREAARAALIGSAKQAAQTLDPFKEC